MDDLISEFVEETSESLSALDTEIVRLESQPDDAELIGGIFRLLHTVKGTCGFLGLPRLASVAHAGENVLDKIRHHEIAVTPEAISLILASFDRIKTLMDHLAASGSEPAGDDSELIRQLDAFAGSGGQASGGFEHAISAISNAALQELPETVAAGAEERKQVQTASAHELDELERLFQETAVDDNFFAQDISGFVDKLKAEAKEEQAPVAQVPAVVPDVAARAVQEGLKADISHAPDAKGGAAASTQSIRVGLELLERLMENVSELVLTRNQLMQMARLRNDGDFLTPIQRLGRITSELQDGIMKTRMQPISNAWAKFPRLIRDLSIELNKKIRLQMVGEETELDRQLLEMIKDPLTHMVRNSVDHGLEGPAERVAAGKGEEGTVTLRAYHEGGHIIVEIQDDGRGLNLDRIRNKALERGLVTEGELGLMSDQRVMQFIFHAGFSTADKVTSVSGRGVGMDVVRSNIEKIGGSILLDSTQGQGARFKIKIPLTLAIVPVLIVGTEAQRFALPQINVSELVYASSASEYHIETINHMPVLRLRNRLLPLVHLADVLEQPRDTQVKEGQYIVVCNVGGYDFGLIVERVFDTEEIVVKPVAPVLQQANMYAGCTILGDGSVILILDPNALARATGDVQMPDGDNDAMREGLQSFADKPIRFLLFMAGGETPKAVPLDLVARLEEIDVERVEHAGTMPVVQYRDTLMVLLGLQDEMPQPQDGLYSVIAFNYEGKMVGLVIDEIIDIVEERLAVKVASNDPMLIGSMVINEKTTEVIDTGFLLSKAIGELRTSSSSAAGKEAKRKTVLIVDDSPFFRNLNAPYLSAQGFEVLTAEGPAEAFGIMKQIKDIDLIISDIEMPEVSGVEFARQCKQDTRYQGIPMIAYTSKMTAQAVAEGLSAGFKSYVSKTDRDGLVREVKELLQ